MPLPQTIKLLSQPLRDAPLASMASMAAAASSKGACEWEGVSSSGVTLSLFEVCLVCVQCVSRQLLRLCVSSVCLVCI